MYLNLKVENVINYKIGPAIPIKMFQTEKLKKTIKSTISNIEDFLNY